MPRDSIGRRVARAASTGGSRTYRGRAPMGWYASIVLICLIGVGLIAYSRYEVTHPVTTTTTTTSTIGPSLQDQWYAATTFDVCGKVTQLAANTNPKTAGIRSLGSGIILIAPGTVPNSQAFAGDNATLAQFVTYYEPAMTLTSTSLQLPGKNEKKWVNGDKCGATPGEIQIKVWSTVAAPSGSLVSPDPAKLKFANGQMIVVAFVPKGANIPAPPKATQQELTVLYEESQSSTTTTVPTATTPTTSSSTTTTAPGHATTTTAAGHGTSTTVPSSATTTTKP